MHATLFLERGENSLVKRSPSMRLINEKLTGEKLSSTFDFGTLQMERTRRNSIPSQGYGRQSEARGSVPVLHVPQRISGRPTSAVQQNQAPKSLSFKFYHYLKGTNDQNSASDLTKLEETLQAIKNQLDDMSAENRSVGKRVSMLSQEVTNLSKKMPPAKACPSKSLTIPNGQGPLMARFHHLHAYSTLPSSLPIERTHSQPPLIQVDSWDSRHSSVSSESSDTPISQCSQDNFDPKVIHSTQVDNRHQIITLTLSRGDNGDSNESLEQEDKYLEGDEEDVFAEVQSCQ